MGPFYPTGYAGEDDFDLTLLKGRPARALGDVIEVSGRVLDRLGNPVGGAKLELWQANANGRYAHGNDTSAGALDPNFQGMARLVTGPSGVDSDRHRSRADRKPETHLAARALSLAPDGL